LRLLSPDLETAFSTGVRHPAYKLYAYDKGLDNISTIAQGLATQVPLDLTTYVEGTIQWTPIQLSFTLADPDGGFHPDFGSRRNYLADGAIIRLREGDSSVPESEWPWTFTGIIRGQSGWQAPERGKMVVCKIVAFSRENCQSCKRRLITTPNYSMGTDLGIMLHDIASTFLGLSDSEILVPKTTGRSFMFPTNQLSQVSPWDGLTTLLEAIMQVPFFNGAGQLSSWSKAMGGVPARTLPDYLRVYSIDAKQQSSDVINKVRVTFLNSVMTRVEGSNQCLGKANITSGFFAIYTGENIECWWSQDHSQRACNTKLHTIKSINHNLIPNIATETYQQLDDFRGRISINFSTLLQIDLIAAILEYVLAGFIPDGSAPGQPVQTVPATGTGVTIAPWPDIPWGKVIQSFDMLVIMGIMASIGSAQYEIWGTPFSYCYPLEYSIAIQDGINYWDEVEKQIRNDFIGTMDQADSVSIANLIFEYAQAMFPRTVRMDDDLALEMGDIIQLPDGRRICVQQMQKTIERGKVPLLQIDGFKVETA
jgi:hypothetical protein